MKQTLKRHIVLNLVLTLHCAAWAWQPAPDSMLTEWGAKLTPETAWQEYPRPALARSSWSNLNGLWNPQARNWGYGGLPKDKAEWLERYKTSIAKLAELKKQGIAAGISTQTTDVEGEINGLITGDRKVRKLEPAALAAIHRANGVTELALKTKT